MNLNSEKYKRKTMFLTNDLVGKYLAELYLMKLAVNLLKLDIILENILINVKQNNGKSNFDFSTADGTFSLSGPLFRSKIIVRIEIKISRFSYNSSKSISWTFNNFTKNKYDLFLGFLLPLKINDDEENRFNDIVPKLFETTSHHFIKMDEFNSLETLLENCLILFCSPKQKIFNPLQTRNKVKTLEDGKTFDYSSFLFSEWEKHFGVTLGNEEKEKYKYYHLLSLPETEKNKIDFLTSIKLSFYERVLFINNENKLRCTYGLLPDFKWRTPAQQRRNEQHLNDLKMKRARTQTTLK